MTKPLVSFQESAHLAFERWGRLVAKYQVATLLAVATVISSVLTSALGLYFASPDPANLWDFLSRPLHRPYPADTLIWWGDDVRASTDERCWAVKPVERLLTIEQIWTTRDSFLSEHGVIDKSTLHHESSFVDTLDSILNSTLPHSVYLGVTSPLEYWNNDEHTLLSDPSPLNSLQNPPDVVWASSGLPVTPSSSFAHRSSSAFHPFHSAEYIVLNVFLVDTPESRQQFMSALRTASVSVGRLLPSPESSSRRILLRHHPYPILRPLSVRYEDFLILIGYVGVGLYIYFTLRRIDRVHSRAGLVFTGIIQMFVSGLLSLSACKLAGVQFSLVPWKLIPFLIIVLGVDSNFSLVTAVTSTTVDLPILDRVGKGLGAVGLTLASSLAVEIFLLSICFFSVGPGSIRELLLFALVALLADYALQSTFFLTVVSIDIQRLELADLLRQGDKPNRGNHRASSFQDINDSFESTSSSLLRALKDALRARAARAVVFIIIVGANIILYCRSGSSYYLPPFCGPFASAPLDNTTSTSAETNMHVSHEDQLWKLLNPNLAEYVHVTIPPPTILSLGHDLNAPQSTSSWYANVFFRILTVVRVHVFPVVVVDVLLYFLLRYLLKGAELLQAAKRPSPYCDGAGQNSGINDEEVDTLAQPGHVSLNIHTHVTPHEADVELIASAQNLILSWSTFDDHILLANFRDHYRKSLVRIPLADNTAYVSCLQISKDGRFAAISDSRGAVMIWEVEPHIRRIVFEQTTSQHQSSNDKLKNDPEKEQDHGQVVVIMNQPVRELSDVPPLDQASTPPKKSIFHSIHEDGTVFTWDCQLATVAKSSLFVNSSSALPASPSQSERKVPLEPTTNLVKIHLPTSTESVVYPTIGGLSDSGKKLQIWRGDDACHWSRIGPVLDLSELDDTHGLTTLATGDFLLDGSIRRVVVVGTRGGKIGMWDIDSGKQVVSLSITLEEAVTKIRLASAPQLRCFTCHGQISDGFFLVTGTATEVRVHRIFSAPRECRPNPLPVGGGKPEADGGPTGSMMMSPMSVWQIHNTLANGSPTFSRSLQVPSPSSSPSVATITRRRSSANSQTSVVNEDGSIPVSVACHGLRRSTEKGSRRRSGSNLSDEWRHSSGTALNGQSGTRRTLGEVAEESEEEDGEVTNVNNVWGQPRLQEQAILEKDLKGNWELCDDAVVGVSRRRVAAQKNGVQRNNVSSVSALAEGWEAWTVNLASSSSSTSSSRKGLPIWRKPIRLVDLELEEENLHKEKGISRSRSGSSTLIPSLSGRKNSGTSTALAVNRNSSISPASSSSPHASPLTNRGSPGTAANNLDKKVYETTSTIDHSPHPPSFYGKRRVLAFSKMRSSAIAMDGKALILGMGNCITTVEQSGTEFLPLQDKKWE